MSKAESDRIACHLIEAIDKVAWAASQPEIMATLLEESDVARLALIGLAAEIDNFKREYGLSYD